MSWMDPLCQSYCYRSLYTKHETDTQRFQAIVHNAILCVSIQSSLLCNGSRSYSRDLDSSMPKNFSGVRPIGLLLIEDHSAPDLQ